MAEQSEGVVLAIGGLFFRSPDPDRLTAWYRDRLGVGAGCAAEGEPNEWSWRTQGGEVVFAPFSESSDSFAADKRFIFNERRDEWDQPETGRFARIHDPDGNPIELWEPPAA